MNCPTTVGRVYISFLANRPAWSHPCSDSRLTANSSGVTGLVVHANNMKMGHWGQIWHRTHGLIAVSIPLFSPPLDDKVNIQKCSNNWTKRLLFDMKVGKGTPEGISTPIIPAPHRSRFLTIEAYCHSMIFTETCPVLRYVVPGRSTHQPSRDSGFHEMV